MTTLSPAPAGRDPAIGGRLAGQVYDRLRHDLLTGRYRAGEPITVVGLRAEYGVSKQPVMEALRALAADRLVEIQPQVGVRVSHFSRGDVETFFWMFSRTEGAMAYRAALARTEGQLAELAELCTRVEGTPAADEGGEDAAYLEGNRRIHDLVHAMAHAPLAADISRRLWDLSDFLIVTHGEGFTGDLAERHHAHREVLAAIAERDAARAEEAMTHHILQSPLA